MQEYLYSLQMRTEIKILTEFVSLAMVQEVPQPDPRPLTCVLKVLSHPAVQLQPEAPEVDMSLDIRLCLRPCPCLPHQLFLSLLHLFTRQCHQSIQLKHPIRWSAHWDEIQCKMTERE